MRVQALKVGFAGGTLRHPGDVFDMPEGAKGSWFTPLDKAPATGKAPKKGQPQQVALSQVGQSASKTMVDLMNENAGDSLT